MDRIAKLVVGIKRISSASKISSSIADNDDNDIEKNSDKSSSSCSIKKPLLLINRGSSKRSSIDDLAVTEKIHKAVWPGRDLESVLVLLERHPQEIHKKYGIHKETLLHR